MGKQPRSWRSLMSYVTMAGATLLLLPFALPLTVAVYTIVWLYTWTHDPRASTNLLRVLPLHPRRVYKCSRALWSGMLDGLGGPTIAIIFSYMVAKLSRSSRPQDTAVRDIKYGPQAKHRLDLFVPIATQQQQQGASVTSSEKERFPILIIFPGYRWSKTKRARMYRPMAQTLCGDGMFVVLPRVGGVDASLEDILCDFHLTVQWVFENAVNFGGDPKRVHLMGYGAGAHLCMMYSLIVPLKTWYAQADRMSPDAQLLSSRASDQCLRRWLRKIRRVPRPVAGLILVSGVFDIASQRRYETERCIENLSATAKAFGGSREREDAWSPAAIVRRLRRCSAFIPSELFAHSVLLIHGKRDSTFVLTQSQRLFRELAEIDVPDVNMKIYANLRRVDPSIALLAPASALAQSLLEDIRASVSPAAHLNSNNLDGDNHDGGSNGTTGDSLESGSTLNLDKTSAGSNSKDSKSSRDGSSSNSNSSPDETAAPGISTDADANLIAPRTADISSHISHCNDSGRRQQQMRHRELARCASDNSSRIPDYFSNADSSQHMMAVPSTTT
ncbi:hypothetical protein LPJ66_006597 [Kickxella alabastrina]|uniref:Uncharacterized protein n=1 Tax=Kickxella alabastrina TaxID=61397 RepID=A0ACC1IHC3_9FUNG|nr:hypothetical protein LPJ66_006597 [Kickxella alabastrina]